MGHAENCFGVVWVWWPDWVSDCVDCCAELFVIVVAGCLTVETSGPGLLDYFQCESGFYGGGGCGW